VPIQINAVSLEPLLILRLKKCNVSTKMCRTDPSVMFSTSMSATILIYMVLVWRIIFGDCQHYKLVLHTVYHLVPTFKEEVGEQELGVKKSLFFSSAFDSSLVLSLYYWIYCRMQLKGIVFFIISLSY